MDKVNIFVGQPVLSQLLIVMSRSLIQQLCADGSITDGSDQENSS